MNENWRPAGGYEGYYEVSDLGRVRSLRGNPPRHPPGHILNPSPDSYGYPRVHLYREGVSRMHLVHHLVAGAFLGPRPPGMEVNHIHGRKHDPCVGELEYATHLDNSLHAVRTGLAKRAAGERNASSRLTACEVRQVYALANAGTSTAVIAARFGVCTATVWAIRTGRTWSEVTGHRKQAKRGGAAASPVRREGLIDGGHQK